MSLSEGDITEVGGVDYNMSGFILGYFSRLFALLDIACQEVCRLDSAFKASYWHQLHCQIGEARPEWVKLNDSVRAIESLQLTVSCDLSMTVCVSR